MIDWPDLMLPPINLYNVPRLEGEKEMKTAYIRELNNGNIEIMGSKESLEALGNALIMKSKMGKDFQCTIADDTGANPAIVLTSDEDFGTRS